jgi:general secretion pathway protein D
MRPGKAAALAATALFLAGCGQQPIKPAPTHIRDEAARVEGAIPPPVQITPLLPQPKPTARPETYSVVVNNVRVQELLFALARDARLNVDIHPDITGSVTLNAIDQTLPQLLTRIARQVDMRYEIDGQNLMVMRDSPFLRSYKVDYLSAARNVKMQSTASTQFAGGTGAAAAASTTGATAQIDVTAENKLWESIVQNVKDILRETDKLIPAPPPAPAPPASGSPPPTGAGQQPVTTPQPQPAAPREPGMSFQEAASVIGNRESGILYVRASSKQHEKVQEFLDQVLVGAKRQVLIEATVAEVQLNNKYQRGIEFERLRPGGGIRLSQPAAPAPTGFNPPNPFTIGYVSSSGNFSLTLSLLEQFGDVRVLSSPKLSVLNNQTAILRVTRDIIYFTITPSTQPITISGGGLGGTVVQQSFTTTPNVAAEGFMMSVLPQINENEAVVLSVRPTIRRQVGTIRDPNPALRPDPLTPTVIPPQNDIPLFETREFDSILRLQSGEIAVLAGLIQDVTDNKESGIPGVRSLPFIGEALSSRSDLTNKTELVIFLRATVIRDPSLQGDFRNYRDQLPRADFFSKPNPQRVAPPLGPEATRPPQ